MQVVAEAPSIDALIDHYRSQSEVAYMRLSEINDILDRNCFWAVWKSHPTIIAQVARAIIDVQSLLPVKYRVDVPHDLRARQRLIYTLIALKTIHHLVIHMRDVIEPVALDEVRLSELAESLETMGFSLRAADFSALFKRL